MLKKMLFVASLGVIAITQANAQQPKTEISYADGQKFPPTLTTITNISGYQDDSGQYPISLRNSMLLTEKVVISNNYRLQNGGFRYLPSDVADKKLPLVLKVGYLTQQQLMDQKDSLSIFLTQDPNTAKNLGLYKQRMIGWNEGKVPFGMTVQQATLNEAYFDFLNIPLNKDVLFDQGKMNYLSNRLSLKDMDALHAWLVSQPDSLTEKPLIDIIAEMTVDSKIKNGIAPSNY